MAAQRRSLKGLSDADVAALQRLVNEQVEENMGMSMIYTIVAAAQEWLRDKVPHLSRGSRQICSTAWQHEPG